MSKIYFDDCRGSCELAGAELHYFRALATDALVTGIGGRGYIDPASNIFRMLYPDPRFSYLFVNNTVLGDRIETRLRVGGDDKYDLGGGVKVSNFSLSLNTLLAVGSGPLKLAARILGQAGLHAYVRGENREWLAEIIEQGRKIGVYRSDMGWEDIVRYLRLYDDVTVVLSDSFEGRFPPGDAPGDPPGLVAFETLWMAGLLILDAMPMLEITPKTFDDYHFYEGLNAYQVREMLEARLPERLDDSM